MKKLLVLLSLLIALLLTGCGGSSEPAASTAGNGQTETSGRLGESGGDGLAVQAQLAVGTLRLEETEMAVDETQAAEILPLWRAVLSLGSSSTAAEEEVTAVLNQIQDTMDPAQVQAIADMSLTADSVQAMIAEGTIAMGRGGFGANRGADSESAAAGGPAPGGVPGAGGGPGGGQGGGLGGDPSAMQTRQAELAAEGGSADFQTIALTNAVIRLLENKTGAAPSDNRGVFGVVITAVAEATGLSEDDVRAALTEGSTYAEIIENNGGDMAAVTAQLVETLADSPVLQDQDPQNFITDLLNGSQALTNRNRGE